MSRSHSSNALPIMEERNQELDQKLSFFDLAFKTNEARCIGVSKKKPEDRCSNHMNKALHSDTLKDMVRAGDDPGITKEHFKGIVVPLAARLSCHLHCGQENVQWAVYLALIKYRDLFPPTQSQLQIFYKDDLGDEMDWEMT
jgi:hypothetical protein